MGYIPLHVHTIYTPYQSLITLEELVSRARSLGFPAIGISDYLNTYAHFTFYRLAVEKGVKPVFGVELAHASLVGGEGDYHLTIVAENNVGYKNLLKLVSLHLSRGEGKFVTVEELKNFRENLIVLSGCRKSEISTAAAAGRISEARKVLERLVEIFGEDQVFVELMNHGLKKDFEINDALSSLADELGIACVVSNNDRFFERDEVEVLRELMRIAPGRLSAGLIEEGLEEYYLKREDDLEKYFYSHEEAISRSGEIASRCNVDFPADFSAYFGDEVESSEKLRQMCRRRFILKYHDTENSDALERRMKDELDEFVNAGLCSFAMAILELFEEAARRKITVEISSGAILTSFTQHLLGVVPLNPVEHGIRFELPYRGGDTGHPPMELIVPVSCKDSFIGIIRDLFGGNCVCFHITQEKMSLHTILSRLCDSYGIEESSREELVSEVSPHPRVKVLGELLSVSDHLSRLYSHDPTVRKILHVAFSLREKVLHFIMNSSKIVVLDEDFMDWACVIEGRGELGFVNVDQESIDILGGCTFTVQQSHFISAIEKTLRILRETKSGNGTYKIEFSTTLSSLEDEKTFDLIRSGDTTGVYFLEGRGIRELLVKAEPENFCDLMNLIALYKPATLSGRLWRKYLKDTEETEKRRSCGECVDQKLLQETRGLLLYDTQVAEILERYAGIEGEEAWRMIKTMSSELDSELPSLRVRFIKSAMERGIGEEQAQKIFEFLFDGMKYIQNRAAIFMQAFLSYRTAYLKVHHMVPYFASLLNSYSDVRERQNLFLNYLHERKVDVRGPDVNMSGAEFLVEEEGIRIPLTMVKGVDPGVVERILQNRVESGTYESFEDFFERVGCGLDRRSVECLIDSGVFKSLNHDGEALKSAISELEKMMGFKKAVKKPHKKGDGEKGQLSLFEEDDEP